MASTYVNDLRLNEMATGDQSGSWGTVTNTNLELIAEAFSFGTEAITTNADTHTTTIADGGTDPGRSMFLKYTGTLDSACTITIGPNTVSKLWFIENGTSGSQNIIIKQGSGATITIPPGDTKAIYSDGAGSGGKMVDAFASLSVVDLKVQDDLTFSSDSAVISFGADADTTLTHTDGSGLTLNSTNKLMFNDASQFIQGSSATVLSIAATDEIDLTATAIDLNGTLDVSGTALVTGVLTTTAATVFNGGFTSNGDTNTFTSVNSEDPLVIIKNATNDANSARLRFVKDKGAAGVDGDDSGEIEFYADNDAQQQTLFARIKGEVQDASDGAEGGRFKFQVASHDGEMITALLLSDGNAEDEVDVTIGSGTSSVTATSGRLNIATVSDIGAIGTSVAATLRLKTDGDNDALALNIEENSGTEGWGLGVNAAGDLKFYNSGTGTATGLSAVSFTDSNEVLIGVGSSITDQALQVNGDISVLTFDGTTTGAEGIRFVKSRNSTPGSNTIVADGDDVGFLDFRGDDGTDYASRTAIISSAVDGTPGSNDMPGRLQFFTTADGNSGSTERMRIDALGVVSIKNTGSTANFVSQTDTNVVVGNGSGNAGMTVYSGTSNNASLFFADGNAANSTTYRGAVQYLHNNDALRFFTAGGATNGISIDSSGRLLTGGIASTRSAAGGATFQVSQANNNWISYIENTVGSGDVYCQLLRMAGKAPNDATSEFLVGNDSGNTKRFALRSNGGLANYQSNDANLSDERLKSDITPLGSYWDKIKALGVVTFKYKDQTTNEPNIGLIAQQVESVAPELISNHGFGETPDDGVPYKTIYTTDLYHAAIKALQEAMTRIETLETKVAALEG